MKSVFWLVSMLAISSLIESSYSNSSVDSESVLAQSERCCHRNIVTIIDPMPPGQENDLTNSLVSSCEGPLLKPYKCPLTIDFFDAQMYRFNDILIQKWIKAAGGQADLETERAGKQLLSGIDYWIIGKLIADNVTEKTKRYKDKDSGNFEGGDLSGNFTFKMQLYDPHHRQVVKEAQVSWSGRAKDYTTHPSGGLERNTIREMSQQEFMPLNEIILDYERMPEKCTAEPEIKEVVSRQVVQVSLRDIVDAKGRAAQNFQRILVKAEKGKILNGEIAGEYRVFRIGNGAITLVYEAPDDCKLESDTINVFNSCSINDQTLPLSSTTPDYPIATASVKLVCPDGELEHKSNGVIKSKDNSVKYTVSANSRIPFRINYDVTPPSFKTSGIIHSSVLLEMRLPEEKGDFKFDGDAVWVISGQIVSQKSPKKSLLKITMTSDPSVDIAMRGTVSGKEGHSSITLKEKITSKGVEGDEKIVNDGDVLWAQWEAMVGRNPLLRVNGSSFALPVTTPSIDKETNIIALEMRDGYKNRVVFAVPPNPTIEGSMVGELILHLNGKQISGKSR